MVNSTVGAHPFKPLGLAVAVAIPTYVIIIIQMAGLYLHALGDPSVYENDHRHEIVQTDAAQG